MKISDNVTPKLERIQRELQRLAKMKIHVGIQGAEGRGKSGEGKQGASADLLTIANVHEFGVTIKAKNVKNLAIPISKKSIGKSPRDFPDLFFLQTDDYLYGCIDKKSHESKLSGTPKELKPKDKKPMGKPIRSGKEGDIEFLFILLPSVSIPERSFIRAGYDNNRQAIEDIAAKAIECIVFKGWDAETAANQIGMAIVGMIQLYVNTPSNFKGKGSITKATSNWPDNPLIESGRLRNSITYRIEE
ncbi:MAG: hypothetical protein HFG54_14335 [Lachnospiraceae bacterium]|nr:hypothetical protein [Lachnospiraceae bacterium]